MNVQHIAELSDHLSQICDAQGHWDRCLRAFDDLGVRGIGYGVVPIRPYGDENLTEHTFFRHTYGSEWETAIGKDQLLDADLTTQRMLDGVEAVPWNDDPAKFGATYVNRRLHELENDLGLVWGVTLLLSHHSRNPVSSGIGLHVDCVRSDEEFQTYWAEHGQSLLTVAHFLNQGMLGSHKDELISLSGREKDYLYWSAMGLDRVQISDRLGISVFTLDKPIASVKRKLNARNTTQAVAKAMVLGLIDL